MLIRCSALPLPPIHMPVSHVAADATAPTYAAMPFEPLHFMPLLLLTSFFQRLRHVFRRLRCHAIFARLLLDDEGRCRCCFSLLCRYALRQRAMLRRFHATAFPLHAMMLFNNEINTINYCLCRCYSMQRHADD